MTDFGVAARLEPAGELRWEAELPEDWGQGRTTFGGLVAGIAAEAATAVAGPDQPLRTLDVAFVAPLPPGPVTVTAEVLGAGRSVTQLVVSVASGDVLGTRVHVVAGAARPSGLVVRSDLTDDLTDRSGLTDRQDRVAGDPATAGVPLPFVPGLSPTFAQHIEYRWCSPVAPFTGGGPEVARVDGWGRHRTAAEGVSALLGIVDAWPVAVLPMLPRPVPASTVRWSVHLAPGAAQAYDAKDWIWYESRTVQAAEGYASTRASVYGPDGGLLAWSEQLITVYDRRSS